MRDTHADVTTRLVLRTWWPLAASWLLMGLELPAISAGMARLPNATVNLAAYGGVVFPLSMLIEAPIIMLLSASTALSLDDRSYRLVQRFMFLAGGALTLVHAAIAFAPPLFDLVVARLMHPPSEVLEPARLGLQIMTPWTMSIAYRRTQQGVMIRHGRSWAVGVGTIARLAANLLVVGIGLSVRTIPGIVVGASAVACGVIAEAVLCAFLVRPTLRDAVRTAPPVAQPLTRSAFLRFYLPLSLTPVMTILAMPLASAAMSRMPLALESLAAWPVVNGLTFTLRSMGFAFNEVVVALVGRPHAVPHLRRFALALGAATSCALALIALTPLARVWLVDVTALAPHLVPLARTGLVLGILMPAAAVGQSWFQGAIVHGRKTRGVTEATIVYLASMIAVLTAGRLYGLVPGLYVTVVALLVGNVAMMLWLRYRARELLARLARAA